MLHIFNTRITAANLKRKNKQETNYLVEQTNYGEKQTV